MSSQSTYRIKHVTVDFEECVMTSNEVPVSIDHKAIEVLQLLVESAEEVVHIDQFMDTIWRDKPSSPEVVPAAVARLRKVFKQCGINDELIITVHKKGYRFDPPKEVSHTEQSEFQTKKPVWLYTLLGLLMTVLFISLFFNVNQNALKSMPEDLSHVEGIDIQSESSSKTTQIFILRHTEKADDSENPDLSAKGIERAKYWKKVLQHTEIDHVYTTDFKRNIETALLISDNNSVKPELYYPMSFDVQKFLKLIKGETVLIIGHSNTIPDMVNRLINENKYPPMSHKNYNILYLITINENGDSSSSMLHIETPFQSINNQ
jgi:DNA-binding winged helix-turn-helix (wHTH) protein/broad specificity phosphatase PhoE